MKTVTLLRTDDSLSLVNSIAGIIFFLTCFGIAEIGSAEPAIMKPEMPQLSLSSPQVIRSIPANFIINHWVPPVILKEAKPILNVKKISLDDEGYINVTIQNDGGGSVPSRKGIYKLFVNGQLVETDLLANVPEKQFLYPGGISIFKTGVRLHGQHQRVGVHVDANKEIDQTIRYFNIRTQTFTPARRVGVDLAVTGLIRRDLQMNNVAGLGIEIENQGTTPLPAGSRAFVRVKLGESNVLFEKWLTLQEVGVGERTTINPVALVPVYKQINVDVDLTPEAKDLDTTNNHLQRSLLVNMEPYETFLNTYAERLAFAWDDGVNVTHYKDWTEEQRNDLRDAIIRREQGIDSLLQGPPEVIGIHDHTNMTRISTTDAWQIYLSFVAHYLWLEVNNKVPWSLLDNEHFMSFHSWMYFICKPELFEGCLFNAGWFPGISYIAPWSPLPEYEFLSNFGMIGSNHEETIYALTEWMRGRLSHFRYLNGTESEKFAQWEYKGDSPPPERILYPLEGRTPESYGCTTTSGLYAITLATVNIPVKVERTSLDWYSDGIETGGHTRPLFHSIGKTMGHGDDPYSLFFRPLYNAVPVQELFFDFDPKYFPPQSTEAPAMFDEDVLVHGTVDCVNGRCNAVTEQLTYLYEKEVRKKNLERQGGYLLMSYIDGSSSSLSTLKPLENYLTGPFVKPYFSQLEQAAIRQQLEGQLLRIGGGDRGKGVERVRWRYNFFWNNIY